MLKCLGVLTKSLQIGLKLSAARGNLVTALDREPVNKLLGAKFTATEADTVKEIAWQERLTVAELIRIAIRQHIAARDVEQGAKRVA